MKDYFLLTTYTEISLRNGKRHTKKLHRYILYGKLIACPTTNSPYKIQHCAIFLQK